MFNFIFRLMRFDLYFIIYKIKSLFLWLLFTMKTNGLN